LQIEEDWIRNILAAPTNAAILYKYMTRPTNSPKPHLLPSLHSSLIHYKLKTLFFSKSCLDSSSSPCLPPCLNSKHHPP